MVFKINHINDISSNQSQSLGKDDSLVLKFNISYFIPLLTHDLHSVINNKNSTYINQIDK
jgi:hypothetical protein